MLCLQGKAFLKFKVKCHSLGTLWVHKKIENEVEVRVFFQTVLDTLPPDVDGAGYHILPLDVDVHANLLQVIT